MSNEVEAEVETAIREFTWFKKYVGNTLLWIIYLAMAVYIGSVFLGFPRFAPTEIQLKQIVIGAAAAMGIGICGVAFRSYRRMRLAAIKNDCEKSVEA